MASKSRKPRTKGTLVRGADGVLYFIPGDKLRAFRVPEEHADVASANLDRLAVEKKGLLAAVHAVGEEVHCIDVRLKTPGRRKPGLK